MKKVMIMLCTFALVLCGSFMLTACGKETENVYIGIKVLNANVLANKNSVVLEGTSKGDKFSKTFSGAHNNKRVDENSLMLLTAKAAEGFSFAYWLIDEEFYSADESIEILESHSDEFVAYFVHGKSESTIVANQFSKSIPLVVINGTIEIVPNGLKIVADKTSQPFSHWTANGFGSYSQNEELTITNSEIAFWSSPMIFSPIYS